MNRRLKFAAAATTALMFGAVPALASQEGYYVTANGGLSFNPNLELRNTAAGTLKENFDTGYAYGGALGYDTGSGQRIEIDSLYTRSDINHVGGAPVGGHLDSTSVMLNGQVDLLPGADLTPYAGVGIGFQNVGARVAGYSDHDWKPAYQAEAGLRKDLAQNVSLFGEYRFSQSEAADLSDAGLSAHQHFADHGVLAGVTYHLGE